MKLLSWKILLFLFAASLYFLPLAKYSQPTPVENETPDLHSLVKSGDLIVIRGRSFFSDQIRKINRQDDAYSHCGWAMKQGDSIVVYHLIGDAAHHNLPVSTTSISDFVDYRNCSAFGIYRFDFTPEEIAGAGAQIRLWETRGVKFDYQFDLATNDKMYCSELIYKALKNIENASFVVNLDKFRSKQYIAIDQLFLNPRTNKIYDYAYN